MGNSLPWYQAYPSLFFDATIGWDDDKKGGYRLLLDLIYLHGGRVADDSAYISAQLGLKSKRKWSVIKNYLLDKEKNSS